MDISTKQFRTNKFILAFDLERAATGSGGGVSFSGISTRGGELLTVQIKNAKLNTTDAPTQTFVHLHYDAIPEIRADSCVVLD